MEIQKPALDATPRLTRLTRLPGRHAEAKRARLVRALGCVDLFAPMRKANAERRAEQEMQVRQALEHDRADRKEAMLEFYRAATPGQPCKLLPSDR